MFELAQRVRAAGSKNDGTNHVSDRQDLCWIEMTMQPFLKSAHAETKAEKHTLYRTEIIHLPETLTRALP